MKKEWLKREVDMKIVLRYYVLIAFCGYLLFPSINYIRRKSGGGLFFYLWRDYLFYVSVLFFVIFVLWLVSRKEKPNFGNIGKGITENPAFLFLFLLAFWMILSVSVTGFDFGSVIGSEKSRTGLIYSLVYLLVFVMVLLIRQEKLSRFWMALFLLTGVLSCTIAVFEYYALGTLTGEIGTLLFYNSNHLAYYCLAVTVCAMTAFLLSEKKRYKIASFLVFVLCFAALLISEALGVQIGFAFGLVFSLIVLILTGRLRWKRMIAVIVAVCAVVLILMFVPNVKQKTLYSSLSKSEKELGEMMQAATDLKNASDKLGSNRLGLWRCGVSSTLEKPLFGYGLSEMRERLRRVGSGGNNTVHNEFLEYCSNHGIPALVFYVSFILSVFIRGAKHRKELTAVNIISLCTAFSYLVSSFVGVTMFYTAPYLFLFLASGYYFPTVSKKS